MCVCVCARARVFALISEVCNVLFPPFINASILFFFLFFPLFQWCFTWSKETLSLILFAFFIGYFAVQVPAGYLTHKVGGKCIALFGALFLALLQGVAVFIPRFGAAYFIITMVFAGIANVSRLSAFLIYRISLSLYSRREARDV